MIVQQVKGSIYRKRYVLVCSDLPQDLRRLENELYRIYRSRKKYHEENYAIFLTDQFYKDGLTEFITKKFPTVGIVTVSGTIRKCKTVMSRHKAERSLEESLERSN